MKQIKIITTDRSQSEHQHQVNETMEKLMDKSPSIGYHSVIVIPPDTHRVSMVRYTTIIHYKEY